MVQRLAPPGESDWEAYLKRLPAPMTPARAKGPVLDVAGRRRAGLSEDFVRHLAVYSASKGRRPRLWLFEPWLEEALAAGDAPFTPGAQVTALARDLAPAFALLGSPDDQVLLDAAPPLGHLEHLAQAGLQLPEVVLPSDLEAILQDDLRAPERVVPWGVTARAAALARRVGAPSPSPRCGAGPPSSRAAPSCSPSCVTTPTTASSGRPTRSSARW